MIIQKIFGVIPSYKINAGDIEIIDNQTTNILLGTIEYPEIKYNGIPTIPKFQLNQQHPELDIVLSNFAYYDFDCYCGMFQVTLADAFSLTFFVDNQEINDNDEFIYLQPTKPIFPIVVFSSL